jgi:hypothetical protein
MPQLDLFRPVKHTGAGLALCLHRLAYSLFMEAYLRYLGGNIVSCLPLGFSPLGVFCVLWHRLWLG